MATGITLGQLLQAVTSAQIQAQILSGLQSNGFPVTDWETGGVARTLITAEAGAQATLAALIPQITAGGFLSTSTGDWLTLLAHEQYELDRNPATYTIGRETLICASSAGPYTIVPGELSFRGLTGNIYNNTSGGTLSPPGFSAITHVGTGPTITFYADAAPSANFPMPFAADSNGLTYQVLITTNGVSGTAQFVLYYVGADGTLYPSSGFNTFVVPKTVPNSPGLYEDPMTGFVISFLTGAGHTYVAGDTYTVTAGGALDITIQSEYANDSANGYNYNDPSGSIASVITPLPGVTANNSSYAFLQFLPSTPGICSASGTQSGQVQILPASWAAVTPGTTVYVYITSSGTAGVATFQMLVNDVTYPMTPNSSYTIPANNAVFSDPDSALSPLNLKLFFLDNELSGATGVRTQYNALNTYSLSIPETWVQQYGTDVESDSSLAGRCANRWPTLSVFPTESIYSLWAKEASTEVTRVFSDNSSSVSNIIEVYAAGNNGPLSFQAFTAVQAYLNKRAGLCERPVLLNPGFVPISLFTNVIQYKSSSSLAILQAGVQAAVSNYINSIPCSTTNSMATVRVMDLISAISTGAWNGQGTPNSALVDGIINITGSNGTPQTFVINLSTGGGVGDFSIPAGTGGSYATYTESVTSAFTWVPVS